MNKRIIFAFSIVFVLLTAALVVFLYHRKMDTIPWLIDYDDALEHGIFSDKPVMALFYARGSKRTERIEQTLFARKEVVQTVRDNFVTVKLDASVNGKLVQRYRIKQLPSILFVDYEGRQIVLVEGLMNAEVFLEIAEKVKFYCDQNKRQLEQLV